jgi:uncharacterized protein YcfJ
MTVRTFYCLLAITVSCSDAYAQSYRGQDAAVGGIAGAVIGGIIGHQNDETPEGALIGGAIGAITGSLIGKAKDEQIQRNRYYQHQAWRYQQQQLGRAVSIADVVSMSRSGLSDSVIINHIRTNGVVSHVDTHAIISMHNSGVRENVIAAMQQAPPAGGSSAKTVVVHNAPAPRPVVVHREYHVVPRYHPSHRLRYVTRPAFPTYPSRAHFHHYW